MSTYLTHRMAILLAHLLKEKRGQVLPFAKRLTAQGQDSLGRESGSAPRFATWLP